MEVYYKVKLDEKINDIEKVESIEKSNVYNLSNIKSNFKYDNDEILTFSLDCNNIVKEKNRIFKKIKHIKNNNMTTFQVIVFNYNKNNEPHIFDLIQSIKVMLLPTILEKYATIWIMSLHVKIFANLKMINVLLKEILIVLVDVADILKTYFQMK